MKSIAGTASELAEMTEDSGSVSSFLGTISDDESSPDLTVTAAPTSWSAGSSNVSVTLTARISEAIGKNLSITVDDSDTV